MEEANLPDGLSGRRHAQTRCDGPGPAQLLRAQIAVVGHAELRPGPHSDHGHVRHLAMADEPAAGRSGARSFLATTAALAGAGFAGTNCIDRTCPNADG